MTYGARVPYPRDMTTTQTTTAAGLFDFPVSRYLIADLEQIAKLVSYPDYEMNARGRSVLAAEVAKSFRRQMMPAKGATFDAAVEWCAAKPYAA